MTLLEFYQLLFDYYGEQHWWPSKNDSHWEIIAGAILTQNCAWTNVEKALMQLKEAKLVTPQSILTAEEDALQSAIRPAGFFRQKSVYLREAAQFFIKNETDYLIQNDVWELRNRLLKVKGIGHETADSILLYAFNQPIFVIDAYTRRVAERHLGLDHKQSYNKLQKTFMDALPADVKLYNEYHALIVRLCKDSCLKRHCSCHQLQIPCPSVT